jgi:predicted GNAT family acetyltransferase
VSTTVRDNPDESRYEIHVDDKLAGFAQYHLYGKLIAFLHTEIDSEYEGQGLGSTLIRQSLDSVRERGLAVQPFCPFVRAVIAKNPDYLDLVRKDEHERFDLDD